MKENLQVNEKTTTYNSDALFEGQWFEVDPKRIKRSLFEIRDDEADIVEAKQLISEAFKEMQKNPNKYARSFKVMIPKKVTYIDKRFMEIINSLNEKNEHIADWVELALVWAQRISNGETWKTLHINVSFYGRFIIWKDGNIASVGGSTIPYVYHYSELHIIPTPLTLNSINRCCVPVIASYDV